MPTGYTAAIADGITFEQYALACARAFGALIMMRDEPSDAPIPEAFQPSDYNLKALTEARDRLAKLDSMSMDDANAAAIEEYLAACDRHRERIAKADDMRDKYNSMLAQVAKWEPPTADHVEYKNFMLKQIQESIEFDCNVSYYTEPVRIVGAEWLPQQIEKARRDIAYHTEEHAKELERTDGRNAWIRALRDSLGKEGSQS